MISLPKHLTRFVGRSGELIEITRLLGSTRLLTLTGAGGSGKTRLAREAAACIAPDFSCVGWVDLAPITDPARVAQQVTTELRLPDRLSESAIDSLIFSIGQTRGLLVLDNCEHLIDACAALVDELLRQCPGLSVLATSREAFGIASETAWLVPALAAEDGVQLFIERAKAALPAWASTEADLSIVRDICRRLDGMPLAIELAAARVRVLSLDQIAGRLDDAFRLLTTGSRTALPRHRTLRGTMDWSYGLLDDREQRLLRRLAVFAGTFNLDAAESVCAASPLELEDILDGVAALVDKSLVVMVAGDGDARYRLLETVRQYGVELLTESGELGEMRTRHGEYFLEFAERIIPGLIGGESEPGFVARVSPDYDNMRAASAWALTCPDRVTESLRFAGGLFWYWYCMGFWLKSGQLREGRRYVDAALARAPNGSGVEPLVYARALLSFGLIAIAQGEDAAARDALTISLDIARRHGDDTFRAYVLCKLGGACVMLGELSRAMELLDEAYVLSLSLTPQMVQGFVMYWRGIAAFAQGNADLARAMFQRCVALGVTLSHRTVFAHSSSQLGRLLRVEGKHEEAFVHLGDAVRVHFETGDVWGLAIDLDYMASLTMARGRVVDAVRLLGAVDTLRANTALAMPATEQVERDRLVAIGRHTLGSAFDAAYADGRALRLEDVVQVAYDAGGTHTGEYRVPAFYQMRAAESASDDAALAEPALRVLALGDLQVFVNGEPVADAAWGSARSRELLVYLLMHPDGCTKEQVGLAFWPDASTAQVRNNFHVTLHRLRKALRNPRWIVATTDRYGVGPTVGRAFDVESFERNVTAARRALARSEHGAAASLDRALAEYRGDFLDAEPVGDWHVEHRDRLQRLYTSALMELGAQYSAEARHADAAEAYRRVLSRDDFHEEAALALMHAQTKMGERAQALRYYRRFADRMQRELETVPGEELTGLYEELKEGSSAA